MRLFEFNHKSFLSTMVRADQEERKRYQGFVEKHYAGDYEQGAKSYAKKMGRQEDDIFGEKQKHNDFKKLSSKFQYEKFDQTDWKNFWLIAQHADSDRGFQKICLSKIEKYLGKESSEYKYLYDRILCGLKGTQVYGTQDVCQRD